MNKHSPGPWWVEGGVDGYEGLFFGGIRKIVLKSD